MKAQTPTLLAIRAVKPEKGSVASFCASIAVLGLSLLMYFAALTAI